MSVPLKGKREDVGDVEGREVSSSETPGGTIVPICTPWWRFGRCVCLCMRVCVCVIETRNAQGNDMDTEAGL